MNKMKLLYLLVTIALFSLSAEAQDVIVSIEDVELDPQDSMTVPIMLEGVTDFGSGTVELAYNPGTVEVMSVSQGDCDSPFYGIDNANGTTTISAFVSQMPGPGGDIVFTNLVLKAVGSPGATSPLGLTVTALAHSDGSPIMYAISSGTFSIPIDDDAPPSVTGPTASPDSIAADGTEVSTLAVTVTDDASGVSSVAIDLSYIGGPSAKLMNKAIFPPGRYITTTTVAVGTLPGTYCLPVNATDNAGHSNTTECIAITVTAPVVRGDLNGDLKVAPADAVIALKIAVGSSPYNAAADVSGDNRVTSLDALMILQLATQSQS